MAERKLPKKPQQKRNKLAKVIPDSNLRSGSKYNKNVISTEPTASGEIFSKLKDLSNFARDDRIRREMSNITAKMVADLRNLTGSGMMDCKKALDEADGNMEKAVEILKKKGVAKAAKKADRETKEGLIDAYIHSNGKIGVLVEVLSETDFVARNDEFKEFVHDVALHIAAMNPKYLRAEDADSEEVAKEKALYLEEVKESGKPAEIAEKIVEGKLKKFTEAGALLSQPFVKDPSKTINDILNEKIAKIGEKIEIKRFCRFEIGN